MYLLQRLNLDLRSIQTNLVVILILGNDSLPKILMMKFINQLENTMPSSKRQHLNDLIALFQRSPEGLSTPEIGQYLGVTRQTARNYIYDLGDEGIPIFEENRRYYLDSEYNHEIRLSLAQAWFMYLPLRRIVRADLHRLPLVGSLLYRIAALFDPEIADQLIPEILGEEKSDRDHIFQDLVACWKKQRHIEIRYQRPNTDHAKRLIVAPWWFEPAVWSDAFYLIGGLLQKDESHLPITLKLERIQSTQPLNTTFERPPGHKITARLEESWGIWVGDEEPIQVVLRFDNRQHQRLKETRWHPTEEIFLDNDGTIIWQARVSEPQEMLPWIRGWGADVEVLEPDWVREQIARDAEAAALLYGRDSKTNDATRFF